MNMSWLDDFDVDDHVEAEDWWDDDDGVARMMTRLADDPRFLDGVPVSPGNDQHDRKLSVDTAYTASLPGSRRVSVTEDDESKRRSSVASDSMSFDDTKFASGGMLRQVLDFKAASARLLQMGLITNQAMPFDDEDISGWRPRRVLCPGCHCRIKLQMREEHERECTGQVETGERIGEPNRFLTASEQDLVASSRTLADFEMLETIGSGTFGTVKLCRLKGVERPFCIKILSKPKLLKMAGKGYESRMAECIMSERNILERVHHPFIVNMLRTFQDECFLYMILEFVPGGEVFSHLRQAGRFRKSMVQFYAAQIVLVFEYLHSLEIVYRDLKLENLLIADNGYIRVIDFGFAKRLPNGASTFTMIGTSEYLAPEVISGKGHGLPVDWWALGVLVYEMLLGSSPFYHDRQSEVFDRVLSGKIDFPSPFEVACTPFSPNRRGAHSNGSKVAAEHEEPDFIRGLLTQDPRERLGSGSIEELKQHRFFVGINWEDLNAMESSAPFVPQLESAWDLSMFLNFPEGFEADMAENMQGQVLPEHQALFQHF